MSQSDDLLTTSLMSPEPRGQGEDPASGPLADRYLEMVCGPSISWTAHYRLLRQLGRGGQGVVCLADRLAAHNIAVPVALKFFSPVSYASNETYRSDMRRICPVPDPSLRNCCSAPGFLETRRVGCVPNVVGCARHQRDARSCPSGGKVQGIRS